MYFHSKKFLNSHLFFQDLRRYNVLGLIKIISIEKTKKHNALSLLECFHNSKTLKTINSSNKINTDASINQNTATLDMGKCYKISMENIIPNIVHKNVCTL